MTAAARSAAHLLCVSPRLQSELRFSTYMGVTRTPAEEPQGEEKQMQHDLRETSWSHGPVARTVPQRPRVWRRLMVGGLLAGSVSLVAFAAPAYAINDPRVPANECSAANSASVGDPLDPGNPGINFHTPQVSPFVSGNNPGVSTGAMGQLRSNAIGTCANS